MSGCAGRWTFDAEKGYGWSAQDARRLDVFVHYPAINAADYRPLEENQLVSFDVTRGSKGPHSENVTAQ